MPINLLFFRGGLALLFFAAALRARAADNYAPGLDSKRHEGIPKGELTKYTFDDAGATETSGIFPGAVRDYWVYVPRQYDPSRPACLYVGQDGVQFNAPVVFDNLIARHEMPVTIGVFIMHGRVKAESTNALDRFNRSYEYDGLGDSYARFVLNDILPEVQMKTTADGRPIRISTNANDHAIGGSSSGAICAFTAAWERPDAFRRVFSSIGTYVDQRGGNDYPALIRKTEPKPLRIFLQDGSNDLDRVGGNWFLANQEMLSALEFAGYEVNHIWGDGGHNGKQATAIFPDAMRWLWKDWPKPVECGWNTNQPVARVVLPDEAWKDVLENGHELRALAVNARGDVFFYDAFEHKIGKIGIDGGVSLFAQETANVRSLAFGPDGRLYAGIGRDGIRVYDSAGRGESFATGLDAGALCIGNNGSIYASDPEHRQILLLKSDGQKSMAAKEFSFHGGLCLTPDQSLLMATDPGSQFVESFHIGPDGSLTFGQPYDHLRIPDGVMESGAGGMAVERNGTLFVATRLGIQMCDQAGRVDGIITVPRDAILSNIVFGGPGFDEIYLLCNGQIMKRKLHARGALAFELPNKPSAPHL